MVSGSVSMGQPERSLCWRDKAPGHPACTQVVRVHSCETPRFGINQKGSFFVEHKGFSVSVYGTASLNCVRRSTLLYQGSQLVVLNRLCGRPIISEKLVGVLLTL